MDIKSTYRLSNSAIAERQTSVYFLLTLIRELTMKYLCLVYFDEKTFGSNADSPTDAECFASAERFQSGGHLIAAEPLEPVRTAITVRVRNGKLSTTDGPFAETKEQLAGFYLLDARDLNEAVQLAAKIPPARVGSIEVRPVRELDLNATKPISLSEAIAVP